MNRISVALAFTASFACAEPPDEPSEGEGEAECTLSPLARTLLEQTVNELFVAGATTTSGTHGGAFVDLAFTNDLVGRDVFIAQSASFVFPCTEPVDYAPTCESTVNPEPSSDPFFTDHDRCFRLGCVDLDVPYVDTYFTMKPITDADDRHAFAMTTTDPVGTSTYASNPLIRWVADMRTADVVAVRADIDVAHVFAPPSADELDASVTGSVSGTKVVDEIVLDLALTFAALGEAPLNVTLHVDEAGALTGSITSVAATLATLDAAVDLAVPLPFVWTAACD